MRVDAYWKRPKRWAGFVVVCSLICVGFAALPTSVPEVLRGAPVGHWSSILPPLLAIVVAIAFRTLVWALSSAFVLGSVLAFWPSVLTAVPRGAQEFIWINFKGQFNLYIFLFLFALVGMIHVVYKSGGIHGLVSIVSGIAKTPSTAKIATFLAGMIVFFDDYSNTVVVGSTMRKLSDRFRVSREKLAYIVDSTTAPVAGLALLSTWIAYEVWLFDSVGGDLGLDVGGYAIFLTIIPFRFYCWGTLIFVFLTSALGRDFGPMLKAERRAAMTGKLVADSARPLAREGGDEIEPPPGKPHRWVNAALPLLVVVFGTLGGILLVGRARLLADGGSFGFASFAAWRDAFGATTNPEYGGGGAMTVLFLASVSGGVVAVALAVSQRILTFRESARAYLRAIPTLWMAVFILVMAWGMKEVCTNGEFGLHTDTYLISLLGDRLSVEALPLFVFLIASGMAFATGTSFGAMGILIPIILPLAYAMGAYEEGNRILFWLVAAAVLDGAIFGDHCSPISDTTVLSSIASNCDHIDHVSTQVVYALTTMVIASVAGYVAVAFGMPAGWYFLLFPLVSLGILYTAGGKVPGWEGSDVVME